MFVFLNTHLGKKEQSAEPRNLPVRGLGGREGTPRCRERKFGLVAVGELGFLVNHFALGSNVEWGSLSPRKPLPALWPAIRVVVTDRSCAARGGTAEMNWSSPLWTSCDNLGPERLCFPGHCVPAAAGQSHLPLHPPGWASPLVSRPLFPHPCQRRSSGFGYMRMVYPCHPHASYLGTAKS